MLNRVVPLACLLFPLLFACNSPQHAAPKDAASQDAAPTSTASAAELERWKQLALDNAHVGRLITSIQDCDIDIRPLLKKVDSRQHLVVEYVPAQGTNPATQFLSFVATYEDDAVTTLAVYDATGTTKLGDLQHGRPLPVFIHWPTAGGANVQINSGTPTTTTAVGTYYSGERNSSPYFEEEQSSAEKVRIKCRHKGMIITLIVMHVPK